MVARETLEKELAHWRTIAADRCVRCRMGLPCPGRARAEDMLRGLETELREARNRSGSKQRDGRKEE